jgi:hypothetical protein
MFPRQTTEPLPRLTRGDAGSKQSSLAARPAGSSMKWWRLWVKCAGALIQQIVAIICTVVLMWVLMECGANHPAREGDKSATELAE